MFRVYCTSPDMVADVTRFFSQSGVTGFTSYAAAGTYFSEESGARIPIRDAVTVVETAGHVTIESEPRIWTAFATLATRHGEECVLITYHTSLGSHREYLVFSSGRVESLNRAPILSHIPANPFD